MKRYRTLLLLATFGFLFCAASFVHADEGDPSTVAGRLSLALGTVSIQPSGTNQWSAAGVNYPIATGDRFYADQDGRAELEFGNAVARIWSNTDLTVTTLADNQLQLGISQGDLHLCTQRIDATDLIEIDTPNGAFTVIRPGDIRVTIYPGDGGTGISVYSGEITVSGPGMSEDVQAGQSIHLVGANPISASIGGIAGADDFDQWSSAEDQRWQSSQSAQYVNQEVPGYEDLDASGQWSSDADYGTVWYPAAIAADWAPYRYGHWVWSGPWGWTWVEDEPWGYAPFHYGRWVNLRGRWGWLPGPVRVRPVWSPALVAFVGGNGFSVGVGGIGLSAWFPLGPGEPYSPWYHCSPHYVDRVNITNIRFSRAVVVKSYSGNDISSVPYSYRATGVTAVRSDNFANGKSVHQNIVNVDRNTLEHAQLIPHPEVAPTARSLAPRPVNNVHVSSQRPTLLVRGGQQMQAAPGARPQPVPSNSRPSPVPSQNTSRSVAAPANHTSPSQPAGLVYRNEPRVSPPSFDQQQPALNQHPGQPLEPQQVENIQQGHAAGPQRDAEVIPHATSQRSAPAAAPEARQSRAAAPAQSHSAPPPSPPSSSSSSSKDQHHH